MAAYYKNIVIALSCKCLSSFSTKSIILFGQVHFLSYPSVNMHLTNLNFNTPELYYYLVFLKGKLFLVTVIGKQMPCSIHKTNLYHTDFFFV